MHSPLSRALARMTAAGLVAGLAITSGAGAWAHEGPKPGSSCAMSGMAMSTHDGTFICTTNAKGKAVWSKPLAASASPLTLSDGWVKSAQSGMSAAFGTLSNPTTKPIRVVAAITPYSPTQLHEVVDKGGEMVMQQVQGGLVIPAGGSLELKPGGNHVMLMKLNHAIKAGSMVPVTFVTADGGLLKTKVLAKVFTGANETYDASSSGMDMS